MRLSRWHCVLGMLVENKQNKRIVCNIHKNQCNMCHLVACFVINISIDIREY